MVGRYVVLKQGFLLLVPSVLYSASLTLEVGFVSAFDEAWLVYQRRTEAGTAPECLLEPGHQRG